MVSKSGASFFAPRRDTARRRGLLQLGRGGQFTPLTLLPTAHINMAFIGPLDSDGSASFSKQRLMRLCRVSRNPAAICQIDESTDNVYSHPFSL